MLLTGMVWAKPVWGTWWTGEAKLTTALIMFFIYVAYLMFRAYYPAGAQRYRLAAIIAVIGVVDSLIVYAAADLWERAHPPIVIGPAAEEDNQFAPQIGLTLLASVIAFSLTYALVVYERCRMRSAEDDLAELAKRKESLEVARA
jgi:heme exporter protein C